jgi:hypothetical protein
MKGSKGVQFILLILKLSSHKPFVMEVLGPWLTKGISPYSKVWRCILYVYTVEV